MKIGFILDTSLDPPDGVQQYILRLGEWMVSQGHEVHYLVGETKRTDIQNTHSLSKNFTVTFNGNRMTIPLWADHKKVKELLSQQEFDVLHVQSPHHPLMAQYIIKHASPDTAVVSTFHILPYNKTARALNHLLGIWLKPSLKRIDTALSVSSSAAVFQKETFNVTSEVLPNVFDYKRFAVAEPFDWSNQDVVTILFLGRLVERKGCQHLLRAINSLDRSSLPKFRVIICGKGALLPHLQKYVQDNGLVDIVEFTGFVSEEDKPRYYASADISVFPSTSGESFGIVLLEAMASGRSAVLAGDNPGYATVMHPRPDLLVNPIDTAAFAEKLRSLLLDYSERQNTAKWGQAYVAEYDIEAVGPRLIKEYELAIAKRNKKQHNKD